MTDNLLTITDLTVDAPTKASTKRLLNGVNLAIDAGEAVALVGESGSGKSLTTRSIMRLLPAHFRVGGSIAYDGKDVLSMNREQLRAFRGREVGMIFQDPRAHINPVHRVDDFLTEALRTTRGVPRAEAEDRAVALLGDVGVRKPEQRMRQYPHQLSGGLLQRVLIASVLLAEPRLLLADEPTTALDVTAQSDVMAIIEEQRDQRGLSLLFITHDLELAAACCDRLAVMYAGEIVEEGAHVYEDPRHPYTKELLAARPSIDHRSERLPVLKYNRAIHDELKASLV
ncbi:MULTISPECIES: ABC transporter ATP-binding protein [unclassified Mycolicibacterium]|uniref:ABC transporter ATP-binding protein n=1 Tax=unclassified Mycolicibacterium TaxID=2636767 RepID=UPI002ED9C8F3